jgi:hypothetical protein
VNAWIGHRRAISWAATRNRTETLHRRLLHQNVVYDCCKLQHPSRPLEEEEEEEEEEVEEDDEEKGGQ